MKDIDFDELDRAVTSALNASGGGSSDDTPRNVPVTSAPKESLGSNIATSQSISSHKVHTRITTPSMTGRTTLARKPVVTGAVAPETSPPMDETPAPTPLPEAKPKRTIPHREGRFMDVVRPGVTVTTPSQVAEKPATPPVQAPSPLVESTVVSEPKLEQSHNASLEAEINNLFVSEGHEPVISSGVEKAEAPVTPAVEVNQVSTESSTPEISKTDEDVATDEIAAELGQPLEDMRPESPFIADAKVEKRPLGGLDIPETTDDKNIEMVDASDLAPKIDDTPGAPVPEELASDLTAIESQETLTVVETPLVTEAAIETKMPEATGPTSIARQYREQPRTASEDDEAGAIFDPQTYQAPVEHPAKKSSGWGWVIACILIIVLATITGVVAWMEGILPVPL